jgi:hypothetical protein
MKEFINGLKWTTAAVLVFTMIAAPAFAAKTTPATGKNSAVPAVPRAIPNLIPYHKFDPPTSKLFDINKLNVSGDLRVRPEFRNSARFGLDASDLTSSGAPGGTARNNDFFIQQWVRLGLHYTLSPDVVFFFQPQYSSTWGAGSLNANQAAKGDAGNDIFARQAFMLLRNFIVPGLTVKAGRQLVVWGNHRMFGHFDWNNVGWSHDGVTLNYPLGSMGATLQAGYLVTSEGDCSTNGGGCSGGAVEGSGDDDHIMFVRIPMKLAGVVLEPTWIWSQGGTGTTLGGNRPSNQSRHTVGARAVAKRTLGNLRTDVTVEGYYQFGDIANPGAAMDMDIKAFAFHVDGGVTLPVPMAPRLGAEFNIASGDANRNSCNASGENSTNAGCNTTWHGFDQMYPTNHIHFGYMDRMAWKNMIHFGGSLNMRPSANSHFEISGHQFYLNETKDAWYGANQAAFITMDSSNAEDEVGSEIDVAYTLFFGEGNHIAWQLGGGTFFAGDVIDSNTNSDYNGLSVNNETWGYTQLWINW